MIEYEYDGWRKVLVRIGGEIMVRMERSSQRERYTISVTKKALGILNESQALTLTRRINRDDFPMVYDECGKCGGLIIPYVLGEKFNQLCTICGWWMWGFLRTEVDGDYLNGIGLRRQELLDMKNIKQERLKWLKRPRLTKALSA